MIVVAICWAAPLAAISLPSMAPITMMISVSARIAPIPVSTDLVMPVRGMPRHSPAITQTTRKARKGLILHTAIRMIKASRARKTISKVIGIVLIKTKKIKNNQELSGHKQKIV
jgi:hypothetical protein